LDQASAGSLAVGSDSWLALGFTTGFNASGYTLDSIQLAMTDASGTPSGFTAYLYSADIGTGVFWIPGSSLGTFSGSLSPVRGGIFTYTPTSTMTLSVNTTYFVVLNAGTAVANGAYGLSYTDSSSYNSSEGWAGPFEQGGISTSTSEVQGHPIWGITSGEYGQMAINATDVPEPGVLGLFGFGGLCVLWHRRKAKAV
jgi:hypothetical protein